MVSWVLITRTLTSNVFTEINTTRLDGKRRQGESQMFIYVQFQKVPDTGNSCTKSVRPSVVRKPGEVRPAVAILAAPIELRKRGQL